MANGMNGTQLAAEILQMMGGRVTERRLQEFQALATAIVMHIQNNMVVTSSGADPQGGAVVSTSTQVL